MFATNPDPPYTAVIFTSRHKTSDEAEYETTVAGRIFDAEITRLEGEPSASEDKAHEALTRCVELGSWYATAIGGAVLSRCARGIVVDLEGWEEATRQRGA